MSPEEIKALPKVLLHDHLDGGLRPSTIVELAKEIGYKDLPSYDADELQEWILGNSMRSKLELYLESFEHTIAVMQTPTAIERIAYECGEDLAADGVVYLETRFAPELFQEEGLSLDEIMQAVVSGFNRANSDYGIQTRILCCALKHLNRSSEMAELAVAWLNQSLTGQKTDRSKPGTTNTGEVSVVGFDLAGPEEGFLCSQHLEAIEIARKGGCKITLHAGEGDGLPSMADAIDPCGAERLGHGVRIIDDIIISENEEGAQLGRLATQVKDSRIPLEVCPTSNLHTGIAPDFSSHPLKTLFDNDFWVTLNTDNRLMSKIMLSHEFENCQREYGWGKKEFQKLTTNAMAAGFCSETEKQDLLENIITPAYI